MGLCIFLYEVIIRRLALWCYWCLFFFWWCWFSGWWISMMCNKIVTAQNKFWYNHPQLRILHLLDRFFTIQLKYSGSGSLNYVFYSFCVGTQESFCFEWAFSFDNSLSVSSTNFSNLLFYYLLAGFTARGQCDYRGTKQQEYFYDQWYVCHLVFSFTDDIDL